MQPKAFARLTRIEHGLMLAIAAVIGATVAIGFIPPLSFLLFLALPPFFIELAAFAMNDLLDVESDRINKRKDRPLVTGDATTQEATTITLLSFIAGNAIAYALSFNAFLICIAFSILAAIYNLKLKDVALLGNAYIALTMAIPFIYGSVVTTGAITGDILILSAMAFIVGLGREIMKTVQDMKGDAKARKARTIPLLIGAHASLLLAAACYLIAIAISIVPFAPYGELTSGVYARDLTYAFPIAACDALLLYIAYGAAAKGIPFLKNARKISLTALASGLLGFLGGALL